MMVSRRTNKFIYFLAAALLLFFGVISYRGIILSADDLSLRSQEAAPETLEPPPAAQVRAAAEQPSAAPQPAPAPAPAEQPAVQVQPPAAQPAPPTEKPPTVPSRGDFIFVPIFVYHSVMPHRPGQTAMQIRYDVAPEIFDRQLEYLKDNGYQVLSLGALVDDLANGTKPEAKSVVLTFDDGWANQYQYALPLLEKYGFTATFFIITGSVGRQNYMTWDQVLDLAGKGMTIGSHSRTHPLFASIRDEAKLVDEIAGSKSILEERLGRTVDLFAYPFGAAPPDAVKLVAASGYRAARVFQGGLWNSRDSLFRLRSIIATDNFAEFEDALNGTPPGTAVKK